MARIDVISRRTWVLGALTFVFVCLDVYCQWRTGCGPKWLPAVHAQDGGADAGFALDPCASWREMPLLDKVSALGTLVCGTGFFVSLGQDLLRWWRGRRLRASEKAAAVDACR